MQRFAILKAVGLLGAAGLCACPAMATGVATTRLEVTGSIIPAACSIALEGGGTIDYGRISLLTVPVDGPLRLAPKTIPITLNCTDPAKMRIKVRDEKAGTVARGMLKSTDEDYLFGLGAVAGKKLGAFKLKLEPDSFKGYRSGERFPVDLSVIYSFSDNVWRVVGGGHFRGNGSTQMSFAPRGSTVAGAYVTISGDLSVETWINKRPELPAGQRLELAGAVVLELVYD